MQQGQGLPRRAAQSQNTTQQNAGHGDIVVGLCISRLARRHRTFVQAAGPFQCVLQPTRGQELLDACALRFELGMAPVLAEQLGGGVLHRADLFQQMRLAELL